MEKEFTNGLMAIAMMEIIKMTRLMAMGNILKVIIAGITGIGRMGRGMDKDMCITLKKIPERNL